MERNKVDIRNAKDEAVRSACKEFARGVAKTNDFNKLIFQMIALIRKKARDFKFEDISFSDLDEASKHRVELLIVSHLEKEDLGNISDAWFGPENN